MVKLLVVWLLTGQSWLTHCLFVQCNCYLFYIIKHVFDYLFTSVVIYTITYSFTCICIPADKDDFATACRLVDVAVLFISYVAYY